MDKNIINVLFALFLILVLEMKTKEYKEALKISEKIELKIKEYENKIKYQQEEKWAEAIWYLCFVWYFLIYL